MSVEVKWARFSGGGQILNSCRLKIFWPLGVSSGFPLQVGELVVIFDA